MTVRTDIWFCSDHHFGHSNIIKWKGPNGEDSRTVFKDIEEHNEALVKNHNEVVKKGDQVYLLGDICWGSDSIKYLKRLHGSKTLVMGNHDKQKVSSLLGAVHKISGCMYFGKGVNAILTHMPVHPSQLNNRFGYNIHGHMHNYNIDDPRYLNVSLEQINYTPINIAEIKNIFYERTRESNRNK